MKKRTLYGYESYMHPYDVSIPDSLLDFFRPMKKYLSLSKNKSSVPVTYDEIEGKTHPLPSELNSWENHPDIEEYPCDNVDQKSKSRSDRAAIKAIKSVLGDNSYSHIKKFYMRASRTRPIKVNFKVQGHKTKNCIYVKKADTNRMIGRVLYDIISGFKGINYSFNEFVFIEQNIPGSLLSHIDERIYLQFSSYREGLVRASVHAEFMGMCDDVIDGINRIVDYNMQTVLFDFDVLFGPKDPVQCNFLLGPYIENNFLKNSDLINYFSEQKEVVKRVDANWNKIMDLAKISGNLIDGTGKTLNDRIKECWRAHSFQDYLEKTFERFDSSSSKGLISNPKKEDLVEKPSNPRKNRYLFTPSNSLRGLK